MGISESDLKKLFLKAAAVMLSAVLTYVGLLYAVFFWLPYKDSTDYLSAVLDKSQLLRSTTSPKILFIGGSSLAFGLDSLRVQSASCLPVVNLGLHGGIGLRFMLDSARPYIQGGDIVVLVPEYEYFFGEIHYGEAALLNVLHVDPEGWKYIRTMKQYRTIWKYALEEIKDTIHALYRNPSSAGKIRSRASFNRLGDMVAHLALGRLHIENYGFPLKIGEMNEDVLIDLRDFDAYARGKGAETVLLFPSVAESYYRMNRAGMRKVYERIRRDDRLGEIVKSMPEDFVFPDACFFDTGYHLTGKCRVARTETTIRMLQVVPRWVQQAARGSEPPLCLDQELRAGDRRVAVEGEGDVQMGHVAETRGGHPDPEAEPRVLCDLLRPGQPFPFQEHPL